MSDAPSQVTDEYWLYADGPEPDNVDPDAIGKWLVFVPANQVDEWWARIQSATEAGQLGLEAKVATAKPNRNARSSTEKIICVYTQDYKDHEDVRRVLSALRGLGVLWRLSYKTDLATIAGSYGNGSAIYVSQPGREDFEDRRCHLT